MLDKHGAEYCYGRLRTFDGKVTLDTCGDFHFRDLLLGGKREEERVVAFRDHLDTCPSSSSGY